MYYICRKLGYFAKNYYSNNIIKKEQINIIEKYDSERLKDKKTKWIDMDIYIFKPGLNNK